MLAHIVQAGFFSAGQSGDQGGTSGGLVVCGHG